jgi:hypothetical protein
MLLAAPSACTQPLDASAADGTKNAPPAPPEDFHTRVIETPAIGIVSDGPTSTHPCERTQFQLFNADAEAGPVGILVQECSGCHGEGGNAHPGFTDILDVASLINPERLSTGIVKGMRLVIPGDPEHSLLYQRMFDGAMPPSLPGVQVVPEPENVPATTSETSVVQEWILHCLGVSGPPSAGGTGGETGAGDGAGGSSGSGGSGGASPEEGTGGAPGAAGRGGSVGAPGGGAGRAGVGAGGRRGGGNAAAGGATR